MNTIGLGDPLSGMTAAASIGKLSYKQTVLATAGITHYFRCNEASGALADSKGTATLSVYSGTPNNVYRVPGAIVGDADQAVRCPSGNDFPTPSGFEGTVSIPAADWTGEYWVKRRSLTADYEFGGFLGASSITRFRFNSANNKIGILGQGTGSGEVFSVTAVGDTTTWHHIVVTFRQSDKRVQIYLDGGLDNTGTAGGTYGDAQTNMFCGEVGGTGAASDMDEAAAYTGILSAATILNHYNVGRGL